MTLIEDSDITNLLQILSEILCFYACSLKSPAISILMCERTTALVVDFSWSTVEDTISLALWMAFRISRGTRSYAALQHIQADYQPYPGNDKNEKLGFNESTVKPK